MLGTNAWGHLEGHLPLKMARRSKGATDVDGGVSDYQ